MYWVVGIGGWSEDVVFGFFMCLCFGWVGVFLFVFVVLVFGGRKGISFSGFGLSFFFWEIIIILF